MYTLALLCAIFVTHTHTHIHTHMHAHTHARTHTDWLVPLAVTLGSYFSHCFHKASCTSIYTLHICAHTHTYTHTQTARTQTSTHKHTQTHTCTHNTHTDCMACTTCSDFGFLFLHCFHKVYITSIYTPVCTLALSCKQPTYSSHTHTHTQHKHSTYS